MRGRFAPSPTGDLHLGNLRTALLAWLFARSAGSEFVLRFEDLDRGAVRDRYYDHQRRDLDRLGVWWDDELRQSEHLDRYRDALATLVAADLTYPCYCTRREIRESVAAPHGETSEGSYPGTCRSLTRAETVRFEAEGRSPALRLRASDREVCYLDRLHGRQVGRAEDLVLARRDGTPAYNLAVIVDDAFQGVQEVVRGDDLMPSTHHQVFVMACLGTEIPSYAHVPLVLGPDGRRLAKRDGAVSLDDRLACGSTPAQTRALLARSAGITDAAADETADDLARRFDPTMIVTSPWRMTIAELSRHLTQNAPESAD